MGSESNDKCPIRGTQMIFDTQKRRQRHRGEGDVKTEAEIRAMWPQTRRPKNAWRLQKPGEARGGVSPRDSEEGVSSN